MFKLFLNAIGGSRPQRAKNVLNKGFDAMKFDVDTPTHAQFGLIAASISRGGKKLIEVGFEHIDEIHGKLVFRKHK